MDSNGLVLRWRDEAQTPICLPTSRFLAHGVLLEAGAAHLCWVREENGCARTWTFNAPGVMFRFNTETKTVDRTLPLYNDDAADFYRTAARFCPNGGGQLFANYVLREARSSKLQYTNLPFPGGLYFSDSFAPPRYQYPLVPWDIVDHDTMHFRDTPAGTNHTLQMTFGTPLDAPLTDARSNAVSAEFEHLFNHSPL